MKNLNFLTAGAALTFVLAGCGGQKTADTSTTQAPTDTKMAAGTTKLNGAGATFPFPLYFKWFDAYKTARGVEINYQSVGSGAGIKQLTAQTVDFGASDAPLKDKDQAAMPSPVVQIPTTAGAVAVAYNLPGEIKGLKLTGQNLADLFSGKITTWNDPKIAANNVGMKLPATKVTIAHRSDGSGTTFIFSSYLSAVSPAWKTTFSASKSIDWAVGVGGKGNDGVASTIKGTPGAVGYIELAYALKNGMPTASIQNKAGKWVEPSVEGTTAAAEASLDALKKEITAPILNAGGEKSYPIASFTYLLVYKQSKDAAKAQALNDFLMWAMKDGQEQAPALNYAPLPAAVVALNEATIKGLK